MYHLTCTSEKEFRKFRLATLKSITAAEHTAYVLLWPNNEVTPSTTIDEDSIRQKECQEYFKNKE